MNRINLIALGVRDMEKSLAFFRTLGFQTKTEEKNPGIVFFNNEGSKLELFPLEELAKDINFEKPPALPQGGFPGMTLACNMKSREEVDHTMKKAVAAGATLAKEPKNSRGAVTAATLSTLMVIIGKLPMVQIGNLMSKIC